MQPATSSDHDRFIAELVQMFGPYKKSTAWTLYGYWEIGGGALYIWVDKSSTMPVMLSILPIAETVAPIEELLMLTTEDVVRLGWSAKAAMDELERMMVASIV